MKTHLTTYHTRLNFFLGDEQLRKNILGLIGLRWGDGYSALFE